MRTHWELQKSKKSNTLHPIYPPKGKKNTGPLGGPWWHTSLVGQKFLCLPLLFKIFDLKIYIKKKKKKKKKMLGPLVGGTWWHISLATKNFYGYLYLIYFLKSFLA
jgi:hypothetical protein